MLVIAYDDLFFLLDFLPTFGFHSCEDGDVPPFVHEYHV